MTPEMESAIEKFLRERLQIRLELDRYRDYDSHGIEVKVKLVLVEPGGGWDPETKVIAEACDKVHL